MAYAPNRLISMPLVVSLCHPPRSRLDRCGVSRSGDRPGRRPSSCGTGVWLTCSRWRWQSRSLFAHRIEVMVINDAFRTRMSGAGCHETKYCIDETPVAIQKHVSIALDEILQRMENRWMRYGIGLERSDTITS